MDVEWVIHSIDGSATRPGYEPPCRSNRIDEPHVTEQAYIADKAHS